MIEKMNLRIIISKILFLKDNSTLSKKKKRRSNYTKKNIAYKFSIFLFQKNYFKRYFQHKKIHNFFEKDKRGTTRTKIPGRER